MAAARQMPRAPRRSERLRAGRRLGRVWLVLALGLLASGTVAGAAPGRPAAPQPAGKPAARPGAEDRAESPAEDDPPPVRSAAAQAAFEAALKLLAAGRAAEAATALTRLGAESPADDVAPEALFEAAQLYDEQLGRPDEAQRLYGLVVRSYPSSRLVRRAEHRLAQLASGLRSGAAPLIRFQAITRTTAEGSPERITRLEALLREEPNFALRDQALYLLGSARLRARRPDATAALDELRRRDPQSEWAARADQAEAEALVRDRRFAAARPLYQRLLQRGGSMWSLVGQEGLERTELGAERQRTGALAWAFLALVGLGQLGGMLRARRSLRALWPPPLEVLYYAPVAAFLLVVTLLIKNGGAGPLFTALAQIAAGGGLLAWLSGASARQRPPRRALGAVLGILWRVLAVLALAYAVLERQELLDLLLETARNGPED